MSLKDGKKQTGIERLENAFAVCKAEGRRAVSPFITAGDPDSETTVAILKSISQQEQRVASLVCRTVIQLRMAR